MAKKSVIITGASSGIGAATARIFSSAGYAIGLIARNQQAMQDFHLPHSHCVSADVTDHQAFKKAVNEIENALGPVDCLINNAGFMQFGDFVDLSHESHEKTVQTNLMSVVNGMEIVLPEMRARKAGTIINISSLADRNARPQVPIHAATKAAVKSLSESLRMANAQYGVRICNVAPAKIKTPMSAQVLASNEICISAEEIAKVILWIYQQPQEICIRDIVVAPTAYEP